MGKEKKKQLCRRNVIGDFAIQHKDGWWVGDDEGVLCYPERDMARMALTIIWQRDGGGVLNYKIDTFTGADTITGTETPKYSAVEAIARYEPRKRIK